MANSRSALAIRYYYYFYFKSEVKAICDAQNG